MSGYRREGLVIETVKLAADTAKGIAVNRAGAVVTSGKPFGVTLDAGSAGQRVAVMRQGFGAVVVATASGTNDGTRIKVTSGGAGVAATTASEVYYAVLETGATSNGSLTGAWINCLDHLTI